MYNSVCKIIKPWKISSVVRAMDCASGRLKIDPSDQINALGVTETKALTL